MKILFWISETTIFEGDILKNFSCWLNLSGYLLIGFIHYENITLNIIVRNYLRRRFNSNLVMNI